MQLGKEQAWGVIEEPARRASAPSQPRMEGDYEWPGLLGDVSTHDVAGDQSRGADQPDIVVSG